MLWYSGGCTCTTATTSITSYYSNSSADQTTATTVNACPYCGAQFGNFIIISSPRESFAPSFISDDLPIERPKPKWGKPKSDIRPISHWRQPTRGFHRQGREMRHRGSFRNFHKM